MQNLKSLSPDRLVENTKTLCAEERRITAEVLLHLAEIESRRLYAELGYSSLFKFAVKELKYSEGAAGRRVSAMRLMREVPEIEPAVRSGSLNVTVVAMAKHATQGKSADEKREVLSQLQDLSQKQAEVTLATIYPEAAGPRERERVLSEDATQVTFTADAALMQKLERLKELLSHKTPNPSYQELFHLMADLLIRKLDPQEQPSTPSPAKHRATHTRYVPKAVQRSVWRKYEGQCSFVAPKTGRRCSSRRLVQMDHIQPFSLGGPTEATNLRLYCRAHNLLHARQVLGDKQMRKYLKRP